MGQVSDPQHGIVSTRTNRPWACADNIPETRSCDWRPAWVRELFPERKGYLDVYDHYPLCGPRAVFGHGIHLTDDEMQRMHVTGSAISHCPTSNFFLGSGYFDIARAMKKERPVRVTLGTDLGADTSFSILEYRMRSCRDLEEALFIQTGELAYRRPQPKYA